MKSSFLQTETWLKFQESVGHPTWRFNNGKIITTIIRHDLQFGKNYLYIPYGPLIDVNAMQSSIRNEIKQFVWYLTKLAKEQKAMFIKIEPQTDAVAELLHVSDLKLKKSSKHLQPMKSVVLDLELSEEELLAQMHHKTRYNINLAEKKGMTFDESHDVEAFYQLLKKTAEHDKFFAHTKDYYQKLLAIEGELQTKLFLVKHEGKAIGGMILMTHGETTYYLHGAMDRDYRHLMGSYFMQWQAIQYAKAGGAKYYDFWGIDAQKWPGITRFKLGFGGKQIEYPGSFDLVISKFWYFVYNLAKKIFKAFEGAGPQTP